VNPIDSLAVLRHDGGLNDVGCPERADTNCDDSINPIDSLRLLRFDAGIILSPITDCTPIGEGLEPAEGTPSSIDNIQAALDAGEVDEETAVEYKVFAVFGDPRLPQAYLGHDDPLHVPATTVMFDVFARFAQFSAETQGVLRPFMMHPFAEGSWYQQRLANESLQPAGVFPSTCPPTPTPTPSPSPTPAPSPTVAPSGSPVPPLPAEFIPDPAKFDGAASASGKYKIWWFKTNPEYEARARKVLTVLDGGIHDAVVDVLGREPLDDTGLTFGDGPAIDIFYLEMRAPVLGLALPLNWTTLGAVGKKTPSAIVINGCFRRLDAGVDWLELTVAHEVFHAGHLAFDYAGTQPITEQSISQLFWLLESTSKWFEDYRYPNSNENQHGWDDLFINPDDRIDDPAKDRMYAGYIWFFYLTRQYGPDVIQSLFEKRETMTHYPAMDAAIPGGWHLNYHDFALELLNVPPVDLFAREDGIQLHAATRALNGVPHVYHNTIPISLNEDEPAREFEAFITNVHFLSSHIYRFGVDGSAGKVPAFVQFNNPIEGIESDYVRVHAVYRLASESTWKVEEWTGGPGKGFCLAEAGENVAELQLVISNANWEDKVPSPEFDGPVVVAHDSCGWSGNSTVTRVDDRGGPGFDMFLTGTATDLLFVPEESATAGEPSPETIYMLAAGTLTWTVQPFTGLIGCTYSAAPLVLELSGQDGEMKVTPDGDGGFTFQLEGSKPAQLTVSSSQCQDSFQLDLGFPWLCGEGSVEPDTASVQGEVHFFTTDLSVPIECPVAQQAGDGGGVHTEDTFSHAVDWEFQLER
jgi:hypothetical protein